ncbi:MAG: hypothetical protein LCH84_06785 [Gemmatimonadetes bacterium]|nr:hypothetical protein [Gemmatimonadota bacterium]
MSLDAATKCTSLADSMAEVTQWFQHGTDWPLLAPAPRADWLALLRRSREELCALLGQCTRDEAAAVVRSTLFAQGDAPIVAGLVFDRTPAAESRLTAAREIMQAGWSHPMAVHAFIIAVLDAQPWEMPRMCDLHACPESVMERYLTWLFQRPVYGAVGDDARYVAWLVEMLDCMREQLRNPKLASRKALLVNTLLRRLDISMVVHTDVSIRAVLEARARLVEAMAADIEVLRGTRSAAQGPRPEGRRIRLGFLVRTIMKHPDPLAFCAQFEHFDPSRYEIVLYSQDLVDRQCEHDVALYQRLFRFVHEVRTLNGLSVRQMIDRVQGDDLDVFVYSYAAQIGASPVDLLANAKLARVQVLMNSHVPIATGLPSFTHVATVAPAPEARASLLGELVHEQLAEIPRVLLSYLPHVPQPPVRRIDRAALRIPADGVVLYNGGAVDKIVPVQLDAWVRALARIPHSWLVLAPFNPGWNGTRGAVTLHALISRTCRAHQVDPRRVVVLRELSPRDTQQLYDMARVYLGTFPHGSSTSVALAMQAGVPAATRRSPWLRGTGDASIVQSIGLDDLVAADADAYVDLVVRLATDGAYHADVCARMAAALPTAPFLASADYGRALQGMFDRLAFEAFGYPLPVRLESSRAA